nr:MAG TPA: hypothetical protein [Crassvirales sp.]
MKKFIGNKENVFLIVFYIFCIYLCMKFKEKIIWKNLI